MNECWKLLSFVCCLGGGWRGAIPSFCDKACSNILWRCSNILCFLCIYLIMKITSGAHIHYLIEGSLDFLGYFFSFRLFLSMLLWEMRSLSVVKFLLSLLN